MITSNLIIVTGLPGTGKTTIARKLSEDLMMPYIGKDAIKELIFDTLGYSDREWSKKVGTSAFALMDYLIPEFLKAGQSVILESNFSPKYDNDKFIKWQTEYGFNSIQILCFADADILFERFKARAESGERHPGNADADNLDEWREFFSKNKGELLDLSGETIKVDTTDFAKVNHKDILNSVTKAIL